ncbi:hypothetical protein [Clostridium akagii]|uniref:hypothetical protein n=1 Tax=Clostridium akagii TaxID=91623 RepID=UPI00047A6836|nr:hypothetical protein [Clostridium akagii]
MDIKQTQPIEKPYNYDFDQEKIYDTKTGCTVAEINIEGVLSKIFKDGGKLNDKKNTRGGWN